MSRDFNAPPVVFPFDGGATAANPRRSPSSAMAPQFQPPHPTNSNSSASNSSLPFMSFDMSAAAASISLLPPTIPTDDKLEFWDPSRSIEREKFGGHYLIGSDRGRTRSFVLKYHE